MTSKKTPDIDLRKFKAWSPQSGVPANVEYGTGYTSYFKRWMPTIRVLSTVGLIMGATYLVVIKPMNNVGDWQSIQKENRKGIDQEAVQPGGMRVWSDPFKR